MARSVLLSCLVLALGATSLPALTPTLLIVTATKDGLVVPEMIPLTREIEREVEVDVGGGRKEKRRVRELITTITVVNRTRDLRGMRFLDTSGKEVDLETVRKRLARPTAVAVSGDGQPLAEAYLRALAKDTLVVIMGSAGVAPKGFPAPPVPVPVPVPVPAPLPPEKR